MRPILFALIFCFVVFQAIAEEIVIDFSHPQYAMLDEEGKNLLSEYAKAYPKIEHFYKNIRMDVIEKKMRKTSETEIQAHKSRWKTEGLNETEINQRIQTIGKAETLFKIRNRSENHRIDRIVNHRVTPSIRAKLPSELKKKDVIPEVEITLINGTKVYQLSKLDPRRPFFSLNTKRDFSNPNSEGITLPVTYFVTAPYSGSGFKTLGEILFRPKPLVEGKPYGIIEYVRQREINGEQVVEIRLITSLRLNSDGGIHNPDNVHGLVSLRKDSWIVKESYAKTKALSSGATGWVRCSCAYEGKVDGVPLLKTYVRSEGRFDKETQDEIALQQMECEIANIIPGPVDLSEFDVKPFLPPGTVRKSILIFSNDPVQHSFPVLIDAVIEPIPVPSSE